MKSKKLEILTFAEFARQVGTTPDSVVKDFGIWSRYTEVYKDTPEYKAMFLRQKRKSSETMLMVEDVCNVLDYIMYHLIEIHGIEGGVLLLHSSVTDLVRQYKKDFPDHHGYVPGWNHYCECNDCSKCPECRVSGEK